MYPILYIFQLIIFISLFFYLNKIIVGGDVGGSEQRPTIVLEIFQYEVFIARFIPYSCSDNHYLSADIISNREYEVKN